MNNQNGFQGSKKNKLVAIISLFVLTGIIMLSIIGYGFYEAISSPEPIAASCKTQGQAGSTACVSGPTDAETAAIGTSGCQKHFATYQSFVNASQVVAMSRGENAAADWVIKKSRERGIPDECLLYLSTQ